MDSRHHIDELQSLRGVAALTVVISHMSSIYVLPQPARIAIDAIFNPHACVIVFFVLSGYVLCGSLMRRGLSWPEVRRFYLGRLFRLFPALWAASALSAAFLLFWPNTTMQPQVTFWFSLYLPAFPSAMQMILAALAIDHSLIMPVWSIFIELMGSTMMPLLVILARGRAPRFRWVVLLAGLLAYALAHAPHRIDSLGCVFDFALGTWLASREWKIFADRSMLKLFGAVLVLVFFRFAWFSSLNGHAMQLYAYDDPFATMIESVAAFFVVGILASMRGKIPLLRMRIATWLGDVSYSLYLVHFPVAILLVKILSRIFSPATTAVAATAILMPIGIAASLALASLVHRFVELPFIATGNKVSKWVVVKTTAVNVG